MTLRVDRLQYQLHCLYEVCKLQNMLNLQTNDVEEAENPKIENSKLLKMMDEFIKIFPMITKSLLMKNASEQNKTANAAEPSSQKIAPDPSHDLLPLPNHSPNKSGDCGVSEL